MEELSEWTKDTLGINIRMAFAVPDDAGDLKYTELITKIFDPSEVIINATVYPIESRYNKVIYFTVVGCSIEEIAGIKDIEYDVPEGTPFLQTLGRFYQLSPSIDNYYLLKLQLDHNDYNRFSTEIIKSNMSKDAYNIHLYEINGSLPKEIWRD